MTLCPIALAVGCKKCPAFSFCPLKGVIGDQARPEEAASPGKPGAKPPGSPAASRGKGGGRKA